MRRIFITPLLWLLRLPIVPKQWKLAKDGKLQEIKTFFKFNPNLRDIKLRKKHNAHLKNGEPLSLAQRLVRVLWEGTAAEGRRSVVWDGRDEAGRTAPSGVYLCRLAAGGFTAARAMTLAK